MTQSKTYQKGRFNPFAIDHLINEVLNTNIGEMVNKNGDFMQKTPPINVLEADNYFKLELAVPGLAKKDISLKVDNGILTLAAAVDHEPTEGEEFKIKQFAFHHFSRTYKLPKSVDVPKIKAHMSHGILTVTMPKKEEQAPQNIEIS